jgi:hypothetical protein
MWVRAWVSTPMTNEWACAPMVTAVGSFQRVAVNPAQRLIVALAAVHVARIAAIRHLLLDDLDLPNRRITIAGHTQRLSEPTDRALCLAQAAPHRLAAHPEPARPGLREDRPWRRTHQQGLLPLPPAPPRRRPRPHPQGPDPARGSDRRTRPAAPSLVFNLSHTTGSRYATIAQHLLDGQLEQPPNSSSP